CMQDCVWTAARAMGPRLPRGQLEGGSARRSRQASSARVSWPLRNAGRLASRHGRCLRDWRRGHGHGGTSTPTSVRRRLLPGGGGSWSASPGVKRQPHPVGKCKLLHETGHEPSGNNTPVVLI